MKVIMLLAAAIVGTTLAGCYVYDPYYPYGYYPGQSIPATYDRAWNAAVGALWDQGVEMTVQDRAGGVIEGRRGQQTVRGRVVTQADGRVRVEFNVGGVAEDPGLPERLSRSYDARMGR